MKRRTHEKKNEGVRLSQKALDSLRTSNLHPGFDYPAALRRLNTVYDYEQIAEFCRYKSKGSISKALEGKRTPSHPQGELIYILYWETFNHEKPRNKSFQE